MSGSISFPRIPAGTQLRTPGFYVDFDNSQAQYGAPQTRALLIGQSVSSVSNVATWAQSAAQVAALCGPSSQIADMASALFANIGSLKVDILPFADNGSGTAATGSLAFSGTTTAAGTVPLYIADIPIPVTLPSGTTATAAATAVAAAINASPISPVGASASTGTVTLTADHKGTIGNGIDVRMAYYGLQGGESMPAGLACSITAMASGAGDPTMTGISSIIADDPYDFIIAPLATTAVLNITQSLMDEATGRWAYNRQIFGHVFAGLVDASATPATSSGALVTAGTARNDQHASLIGLGAAPAPAWRIAAGAVGAAATSLRDTPSRPLQTLRILAPADRGIRAPQPGSRFSQATRNTLLSSGISTLVATSDNALAIEDLVTTYQLNPQGLADLSYAEVPTMFTLMAVTRRLRAAVLALGGGRAVLVPDGSPVPFGSFAVTPKIARAAMHQEFLNMQRDLLVTDEASFLANLVCQIDTANPARLNILFPPTIVKGLKTFAALNQFR
jgi:phage tail sheath gpL-like